MKLFIENILINIKNRHTYVCICLNYKIIDDIFIYTISIKINFYLQNQLHPCQKYDLLAEVLTKNTVNL